MSSTNYDLAPPPPALHTPDFVGNYTAPWAASSVRSEKARKRYASVIGSHAPDILGSGGTYGLVQLPALTSPADGRYAPAADRHRSVGRGQHDGHRRRLRAARQRHPARPADDDGRPDDDAGRFDGRASISVTAPPTTTPAPTTARPGTRTTTPSPEAWETGPGCGDGDAFLPMIDGATGQEVLSRFGTPGRETVAGVASGPDGRSAFIAGDTTGVFWPEAAPTRPAPPPPGSPHGRLGPDRRLRAEGVAQLDRRGADGAAAPPRRGAGARPFQRHRDGEARRAAGHAGGPAPPAASRSGPRCATTRRPSPSRADRRMPKCPPLTNSARRSSGSWAARRATWRPRATRASDAAASRPRSATAGSPPGLEARVRRRRPGAARRLRRGLLRFDADASRCGPCCSLAPRPGTRRTRSSRPDPDPHSAGAVFVAGTTEAPSCRVQPGFACGRPSDVFLARVTLDVAWAGAPQSPIVQIDWIAQLGGSGADAAGALLVHGGVLYLGGTVASGDAAWRAALSEPDWPEAGKIPPMPEWARRPDSTRLAGGACAPGFACGGDDMLVVSVDLGVGAQAWQQGGPAFFTVDALGAPTAPASGGTGTGPAADAPRGARAGRHGRRPARLSVPLSGMRILRFGTALDDGVGALGVDPETGLLLVCGTTHGSMAVCVDGHPCGGGDAVAVRLAMTGAGVRGAVWQAGARGARAVPRGQLGPPPDRGRADLGRDRLLRGLQLRPQDARADGGPLPRLVRGPRGPAGTTPSPTSGCASSAARGPTGPTATGASRARRARLPAG